MFYKYINEHNNLFVYYNGKLLYKRCINLGYGKIFHEDELNDYRKPLVIESKN